MADLHVNCPRCGGERIAAARCAETIINTVDHDLLAECRACPHGQALAAASPYQPRQRREQVRQPRAAQTAPARPDRDAVQPVRRERGATDVTERVAAAVFDAAKRLEKERGTQRDRVPGPAVLESYNKMASSEGMRPIPPQTLYAELRRLGVRPLARKVRYRDRDCAAISLSATTRRKLLGVG